MIDNETGEKTTVFFWPTRLDTMLKTSDRKITAGWLLMQVLEAAHRLWPDLPKIEERPIYPALVPKQPLPPPGPFRPRWFRRMNDPHYDDDDDTGAI